MDIKNNLSLLAEAASTDMKMNTAANVKLDTVKEAYAAIPTISEPAVTEAADVIVNGTKDGYFVEMVNLAPFMMDAGIKDIGKALNLVAEANGLESKSVGLVVESQSSVEKILASANERAKKTGNYKLIENAVSKVNKNNAIIHRLLTEGYKVAKKSDDSKVCPKCGKVKCKCECGDGSCSTGNKAVIAEKSKNEAAIDEAFDVINEASFKDFIKGIKNFFSNLVKKVRKDHNVKDEVETPIKKTPVSEDAMLESLFIWCDDVKDCDKKVASLMKDYCEGDFNKREIPCKVSVSDDTITFDISKMIDEIFEASKNNSKKEYDMLVKEIGLEQMRKNGFYGISNKWIDPVINAALKQACARTQIKGVKGKNLRTKLFVKDNISAGTFTVKCETYIIK